MSEGGLFGWKCQKIDTHRGPAASYGKVHRPLPKPPKNMHWAQDLETKEWRLEPTADEIVAEATIVDDAAKDGDRFGFLNHHVQPGDTFPGICLRYRVTPTELRQANGGFSGTNLYLAPNPLRIYTNKAYAKAHVVTSPSGTTPDEKLQQLRRSCTNLSKSEAKCYLELNDWNYKEALSNAREDGF
jgi:hypothetical protein